MACLTFPEKETSPPPFCQGLNIAKIFVPIQQISKYHSSIQIKERIRIVSKHIRAPILSTEVAIITTRTCKKLQSHQQKQYFQLHSPLNHPNFHVPKIA